MLTGDKTRSIDEIEAIFGVIFSADFNVGGSVLE